MEHRAKGGAGGGKFGGAGEGWGRREVNRAPGVECHNKGGLRLYHLFRVYGLLHLIFSGRDNFSRRQGYKVCSEWYEGTCCEWYSGASSTEQVLRCD